MKRTTIKDIAKRLGLSTSTISRALNDHPSIGHDTILDVKAAATEMKYRPNLTALNFKNRTNKLIAFIVPEITMFFYPSLIKGIEEYLHSRGYTLLILQSNESIKRELENIQIALDNEVSGLIMSLSKETEDLEHLEPLKNFEIPVVLIDKIIENQDFACVLIDDFKAASDIVLYLHKSGCRKIAGIFGDPHLNISHQRFKGYRSAMQDLNIPILEGSIHYADNTLEAMEITTTLLKDFQPDAIFAMTDEIMQGVVPVLNRHKIVIPTECSVMSISDGLLPYFMYPTISHVRHNGYELGMIGAEYLINLIHQSQNQNILHPSKVFTKTEIIRLDSTRN